MDCLFKENEIVDSKPIVDPVIGNGIMHNFGFHPQRLESYKQEIIDMLGELPESFKEGMTFLNMCTDKDDNQWGEQLDCERLMALGNAIGKIEILVPRDLWSHLPGGVPYLKVNI